LGKHRTSRQEHHRQQFRFHKMSFFLCSSVSAWQGPIRWNELSAMDVESIRLGRPFQVVQAHQAGVFRPLWISES
jgi:hypothetical protein